MKTTLGAQIPTILLPKPGTDLVKWAVIAVDQFTSEPEYWEEVARLVGDAPSTFHLILPEVYLETPGEEERIAEIRNAMQCYLSERLFEEHSELILVERTADGKPRHGIMLALDLEQYDYSKGATSLIRATEGTILERIPPRVRIRSGAPLELPHILVLIDDPQCTVIEPLVVARQQLDRLYDFDLMLGSGHLTGYAVAIEVLQERALKALAALGDPATFAAKYALPNGTPVMLYAMGDGNHSLATAKAIWEQVKGEKGMDHPARYALVEIENIHDEGLAFEPIFRVLFDVREDLSAALDRTYPGSYRLAPVASVEAMVQLVDGQDGPEHAIGVIMPGEARYVLYVTEPPSNLPVGTLQTLLDAWGRQGGFSKIDYVHGREVMERLGAQAGNLAFYLPAIDKNAFFKTVILDGALPRKTFSMGEAKEKRFYMEARRIV